MPNEWHFPLPQNAQYLKKNVSQSTRIALKRIEMKKKFTPLTHSSAKPKRQSATLPTVTIFLSKAKH